MKIELTLLKRSLIFCLAICSLLGCQTSTAPKDSSVKDPNKPLTVEGLSKSYIESPENVIKEFDKKEITIEGFDSLLAFRHVEGIDRDTEKTVYLRASPDEEMNSSNKVYCRIPVDRIESYLTKFDIKSFSIYKITVKGKLAVYSKEIGVSKDGQVSVGEIKPCEIVSAEFVKKGT